jgi:hypothetical protein
LDREKRAEKEGRIGRHSVIGILRKELELSERNSVGQKAGKENEGAGDGQKRRSKSRLHAS